MKRTKEDARRKGIKPGSAKAKGRALQQWMCQKISELTGERWGRDCPIESRPMGQAGPDVRLERHVLEEFPFTVECKWQERWSVTDWIEQARRNQVEGTDWLLIMRRSRMRPVIVMDAERFFELIESCDRSRD